MLTYVTYSSIFSFHMFLLSLLACSLAPAHFVLQIQFSVGP